MAIPPICLYQFPISHFCEKARWALDYKGLEYATKNLIPGLHIATIKKLADKSSVPVMRVNDDVIQGAGNIITWLDRHHRAKQLTPTASLDASMAMEWERSADSQIGIPLRCFFYFHVLQNSALAKALLTEQSSWPGRAVFQVIFPFVRNRMREMMRITADSAVQAEAQLERSFANLESRIAKQNYLAGPLFSRADLSVSALLAPMWRDIEDLPPPVGDFIARHEDRPALIWARDIYRQYRHAA